MEIERLRQRDEKESKRQRERKKKERGGERKEEEVIKRGKKIHRKKLDVLQPIHLPLHLKLNHLSELIRGHKSIGNIGRAHKSINHF